jgi:hypothetical protein
MESKSYAFLLSDVIKNDYKYAFDPKILWKLAETKQVIKLKTSQVRHWVYKQCWSDKNDCLISPYQVISDSSKYSDHIKRIKQSDIKYPLIVIDDEYDIFGAILDGNHRFAKIIMEGRRVVNVVKFTKKELESLKIRL